MNRKFDLVIFDCDGVLMDSEIVSARVVADDLTTHGLPTTPERVMTRFVGMSLRTMKPLIEAERGAALPDEWTARMVAKLAAAMAAEVTEIPGARALLDRLSAMGMAWRIASNSADEEMDAKFSRTGFLAITAGRTHSAPRLFAAGGQPKPAPDVFLDAARTEGVDPARCLVIEDSVPGVTGAVAAGMTCYGFAPRGEGATLLLAGASGIIRDLDAVPGLLTRAQVCA
ncbi:MAG: HAD-IA family hydrolase [Acidiphilium sp.]|nr:HAD-IA family hydrolase [Acidiphilium sp.]MDD4936765.1 HAD-IA family hydrolase [Acidiphilium sp.]